MKHQYKEADGRKARKPESQRAGKPESRKASLYAARNTQYAIRFTHHALRITHYVLRITFHVSRFTFHVSRWRWFASIVLLCLAVSTIAEARTENVASLIEARQYQEAIRVLQKLANSTKNVEQLGEIYHQLGEIYYTYTHEYPKALKIYDTIIQLGAKGLAADDQFLGYIKKGDSYCRMGQYEEAIKTYQTLVDNSPPSHFAHQTGLQKIRNIQTALEDLRNQQRVVKTYEGTPIAVEARFQIGELYRSHYQLNQPERAIAEYEAILRQYANAKVAPEAQWRIGGLRDEILNQPALAIEAYRKVVDNYPTSNFAADALFRIARIHEKQKQYELAILIFEQLTQTYPDFWSMYAVFYWSGVCYEKLQDYRQALRAFKTFLYAYLPNLDAVYFGEIGKYNQSASKIETELKTKIQQLQSDFPKVEWERITKLCAEENYVAALPLAQQLIIDVPNSEYGKRAQSELRSIELHAAIQNLQAQIDAQPNTPTAAQALFRIGKIYERGLQDYPRAIEAYSKLINESPKSPYAAEALYQSGLIYTYYLKDKGKAIQLHRALIQQYPSSPQTMMANFQLGEIYRSLHRYDEALKAYQTTIAYPEREQYLADGYKDSFADRAQFRMGRVHYEDRHYDDALAAFKEFIESRAHSPRLAAAYVYLARIHEARGNRPDAAKAYDKAMSLIINGSPIQAEMVADEAQELGFQGMDSTALIKRLEDLRKRMSVE